MNFEHKNLAAGRWKDFSFLEQMANVGSEVERAINWKEKGNEEYSRLAFERALELLDLTLSDEKNSHRLKEIARTREGLVDFFAFDNSYNSTNIVWKNYFFAFTFAARNR